MKKIILILLLLLIFFLTIWLVWNNLVVKRVSTVIVGPKWVNQAQFAGMFVAKERGLYIQSGLDVKFKEFDFMTNQLEDLENGKTDVAIVSAEEVVTAASRGVPLTAIAAIYQISPYAVASLQKEKIHTPADFQGKMLGNKGGKEEEDLFYKLLLSSVGLTENDVKITVLDFENTELEDLQQGKADTVGLYRTDQLYIFNKNDIEYNIIYPEQYGVNIYNDVLVVRNEYLRQHPDVIKSFLKSTVEGWEIALSNPESAIEDTLKYVTNSSYKDKDYELFILNQSKLLIKPNTNSKIGSMTFSNWQKIYQEMLKRGFVSEGLSINSIFTTAYLP